MTIQDPQIEKEENPGGPARPNVVEQDAVASFQKPSRASKSRGPLVVVILLLVLLIVSAIASCGSDEKGAPVVSSATQNTIAVIDLSGTIQYDGSACSPDGFKYLLDEAEADDSIKGVVLRVNSGGGTATAGEEMTNYLKNFSKPVVVSSAAINASAAYEISSQADCIYVAKTTEIGAIGTACEFVNYSDLMDMLGISMDVIVSADSKDSTYGYRELTDEERQHYQEMVDEINSVFIANVAEGRNVSEDKASEWATGLTWSGMTAVEMGIADEVGSLEDACDKAAELADCPDDYVTSSLYIEYAGLGSLIDILSSSSSQSISAEDVAIALKEMKGDVSIVQ